MQRRVRTAANSWRTVSQLGSTAFCVEPARVFAMLVGASPARDGPEGVNPSPVSLMRGFRLQAEGCARRSKQTTDLAISRVFKLGGARTAQFRVEMFNAFNALVYNERQTQLQLVSPTNQTIRNPQFLADGTVDPNRVKTTAAGFGAATGAQPLRTIQAQLRFSF
jgi:hypothetical protein